MKLLQSCSIVDLELVCVALVYYKLMQLLENKLVEDLVDEQAQQQLDQHQGFGEVSHDIKVRAANDLRGIEHVAGVELVVGPDPQGDEQGEVKRTEHEDWVLQHVVLDARVQYYLDEAEHSEEEHHAQHDQVLQGKLRSEIQLRRSC